MTLDSNTAHPQLIVSEDQLSVEFSEQRQQLPDNPERFDYYPTILGSEGFNSGTHSWDVEVGESPSWELGVITESAQRKGENQNWNCTERWILYHCDDAYMARSGKVPIFRALLDKSNIPLTVKHKPQRIRVQLDRDRGRISFLNPDNNTILHTFTHTFTGRVFPCFTSTFPMKMLQKKVNVTVE